ncbi:MAG: thioredoxin family protein [Candidatus Saccharibacteria bacterium]
MTFPILKSLSRAPEFTGITHWFNSKPLTLKELQGKVVLVDFWTFSCVNCLRTMPYLRRWHKAYSDKGLVIVGVHTPEFEFEKRPENVETAIRRLRIEYPVALDPDFGTWNAYANRYWPAHYLIDQKGNIVHEHFGEGGYDETEETIRKLLGMNKTEDDLKFEPAHIGRVATPEIYWGLSRLQWLGNPGDPGLTEKTFAMPPYLPPNFFGIEGVWRFSPEYAELASDTGRVKLNFYAAKVHMVAESGTFKPVRIKVKVDRQETGEVAIEDSMLYTLFDGREYAPHLLEFEAEKGLKAYTFTFG